MKIKSLALAILCLSLVGIELSGQEPRGVLKANDLVGLDNSLEVSMDKKGAIDFIEATYYRGPGIMIKYSYDIVQKPYEIHDLGIATDEDIILAGPSTYSVKSKAKAQLKVEIGTKSIRLDIGKEVFLISSPNLYRVETGPRDTNGDIDSKRRTIYTLQKNHQERGFLGYEQRLWTPPLEAPLQDIDFVAKDCPEVYFYDDHVLEATTFEPGNDKEAAYWYSYAIPLSASREVNLMNYLVLLTQRRDEGDPSYPVIHPVLLTLYFFDALVAR